MSGIAIPTLQSDGDHQLLCNEHGNVLQVGRTAAEQKVRELRRDGHNAYCLRFAPSIYFIGIAPNAAKASALQDLYQIQRAAIQRILAAEALEEVPKAGRVRVGTR